MKKKIKLYTNEFPIPPSLFKAPNQSNEVKSEIDIDINMLAHHMFMDTYDKNPVRVNPFFLIYEQMLTNDDYFKFVKDGYGSHKETRIFSSNLLGKAMCRLFLSQYADISYFAHMDHMLNKAVTYNSSRGVVKIERCCEGDTPDYFCATGRKVPYLAEAKGRKSPVNFESDKFQLWRDQFDRVQVVDSEDNNLKYALKGYIVATRYTDETQKKTHSSLHAEDPVTPGVEEYDNQIKLSIGEEVVCYHYANIAKILGMSLMEDSLKENFIMDNNKIPVGIWRSPYIKGKEFIGFLVSPHFNRTSPIFWYSIELVLKNNEEGYHFFGIEKGIFEKVLRVAREGREYVKHIEPIDFTEDHPQSIVLLKDGSISAPSYYMEFSGYELL